MSCVDILIKGGPIIDPARQISGVGEISIRGNRIAASAPDDHADIEQVIDATGFIVTPGSIDNHTPLFHGATEAGVIPDLALLPMGVTSAVDAGRAGIANCEALVQSIVRQSQARLFCSLNVSPAGQVTDRYPENLDPQHYDLKKMSSVFDRYSEVITGLKIRCGAEVVGKFGVDAAGSLGCRESGGPGPPSSCRRCHFLPEKQRPYASKSPGRELYRR